MLFRSVLLTVAGPISRAVNAVDRLNQIATLSGLTSLVAVVVVIAFLAGIAYGVVAISSQTQLQEDLPEAVRGRVFGVLNMLVSVASFVPIIVVGPIADVVGTTNVILFVAGGILVMGVLSVVLRGPIAPEDALRTADTIVEGSPVDSIGVTMGPRLEIAAPPHTASRHRDDTSRAAEPSLLTHDADGPRVAP